MKSFFFFFGLLISSSLLVAQTDSTDLTLSMSEPDSAVVNDTLLYPTDKYKSYQIEFDLSDLASIEKVQVELSRGPKKQAIYRRIYTISELSSLGKLAGSTVSLDFGNRETQFHYRANITLTDTSGAYYPTITKTFIND